MKKKKIEERNNSRKNKEAEPKQIQHPVVDLTGDRRKVQCCKDAVKSNIARNQEC